ncbi:MAG: hypothetical protein KDB53_20500 [Planctomycetes bacterium]|nr:hypothetical protein [Planctomycetota bacterium]
MLRSASLTIGFMVLQMSSFGLAHAQCPTSVVTSFPFVESFDAFGASPMSTTPPPDWLQVQNENAGGADADWYFLNGPTSTTGTGPDADHGTGVAGLGYYAYVEDSGGNHVAVSLESPCFDLSQLAAPRLRFWYHSQDASLGLTPNGLSIDVVAYPAGPGMPTVTLDVFTVGAVGAGWRLAVVDLSPWQANVVRLRFRGRSNGGSFKHDVAIDDVVVSESSAFDLGVSSVDGPSSIASCGQQLGMSEVVLVTIFNYGTETVVAGTQVGVEYTVDGGTPLVETASVPLGGLASGASFAYQFSTLVDLARDGTAKIIARTTTADDDASNDAAMRSIATGAQATITSFPWVETFDVLPQPSDGTNLPPLCFTQDPTDPGGATPFGDWVFRSTPTPTPGTGPDADHSSGLPGGGFYAYVEDSGNFAAVRLSTPRLDFSNLSHPILSFWVHSRNASQPAFENHLSVDVLDGQGVLLQADLVGPLGHLGASWQRQVIDLQAYAGLTVQLVFRGRNDGGYFEHDLAVDDVSVYDSTNEGGWPPQLGTAVLDLGQSRDLDGFVVGSGRPGYYYTTVAGGGVTTLSISGEALQPIILLSGAKNIGAHVFPAIGNQQMDIGGVFNFSLGVPDGLSILASGLSNDLLSSLFRVGANGQTNLTFVVPASMVGQSLAMQAVVFNTLSIVKFSNAAQLQVVNPAP